MNVIEFWLGIRSWFLRTGLCEIDYRCIIDWIIELRKLLNVHKLMFIRNQANRLPPILTNFTPVIYPPQFGAQCLDCLPAESYVLSRTTNLQSLKDKKLQNTRPMTDSNTPSVFWPRNLLHLRPLRCEFLPTFSEF